MKIKSLIIVFTILSSYFQSCCDDVNNLHEMTNQEFLTQSSQFLMFETRMAKLALQKGSSDKVKHHAAAILQGHAVIESQLQVFSDHTGWLISEKLQDQDQASLYALQSLDASAFDKEFLRVANSSHEGGLVLFQLGSAPTGPPNEDLRNIASNNVEYLKLNLESAREIGVSLKQ